MGAEGLEDAIAELKAALPGWWYSVCECQVSCDATIAPTTESEHVSWRHEVLDGDVDATDMNDSEFTQAVKEMDK